MVDSLPNYIEKEREMGFSDDKIKSALINAGYDPNVVEAALAVPRIKDTSTHSLKSAIGIILGVIILAFFVFFFFLGEDDGSSVAPITEPSIPTVSNPAKSPVKNPTVIKPVTIRNNSAARRPLAIPDSAFEEKPKERALQKPQYCKDYEIKQSMCMAVQEKDKSYCQSLGDKKEACENMLLLFQIAGGNIDACAGDAFCQVVAQGNQQVCSGSEDPEFCNEVIGLINKAKQKDITACDSWLVEYKDLCKMQLQGTNCAVFDSCKAQNI